MADSSAVAEPVAILPSGKPSESSVTSAPSSSSSSSSAPKKLPDLLTQLSKSPAHTDAFLTHLQRTMQSRAGTDAVLMFLCYATRLAGSTLELGGRTALRISARQLVATLFKLPPSTTVVVGSATMPPAVAWAMDLGGRFKAYSAMLSEMRCMGRLWGLVGLYFALKKLVVKHMQQSKASQSEKVKEKAAATGNADAAAETQFDSLLAWAQVISLIVFQGAENVAYLSSKKVLPFSPKTQGRLAILSVRSWGLYVAMEASRLLIESSRKKAALGPEAATKDVAWAEGWKKAFYRNLSWAPLTVHWGVAEGPLPDLLVSLLGFYPAASAMRDMWKSTAYQMGLRSGD